MSGDEDILHISLQLNERTTLMGCDSKEAYKKTSDNDGRNFYLYISTDKDEEAIRIFNELSHGGNVIMPLDQTFGAGNMA